MYPNTPLHFVAYFARHEERTTHNNVVISTHIRCATKSLNKSRLGQNWSQRLSKSTIQLHEFVVRTRYWDKTRDIVFVSVCVPRRPFALRPPLFVLVVECLILFVLVVSSSRVQSPSPPCWVDCFESDFLYRKRSDKERPRSVQFRHLLCQCV